MPETTVVVNCDVGQTDGLEFATAVLIFRLSGVGNDTTDDISFPPAPHRVTLDANGEGAASLWPVDRAPNVMRYTVTLSITGPDSAAEPGAKMDFTLGTIRPTLPGPHSLTELLAQDSGPIVVGPTTYSTLAEAVQAAVNSATASGASATASANSATASANSAAAASTSATSAANSAAAAIVSAGEAENAAIAAGAPIVTSLTSPVPSNGTIEILQTSTGTAVYEVQGGDWVFVGWIGDPFFATRAALVAWLAGGNTPVAGRAYTAAGLQYLGQTGATEIADLPGLVPLGDVYPEHFGAIGDGVADDGAAVQAAFSQPRHVYGREGATYRIVDRTIQVVHPSTWEGNNSRFVFESMGGFAGKDGFVLTIPAGTAPLAKTKWTDFAILTNGAFGRYAFRTPSGLDGASGNVFAAFRPQYQFINGVVGSATRSFEPSQSQFGQWGWQSCFVIGESGNAIVDKIDFVQPFRPNIPFADWDGREETRGVWFNIASPASGGSAAYHPIVSRCEAHGCGKFIETTGHVTALRVTNVDNVGCGYGVYSESPFFVGSSLNALSEAVIENCNLNTIFGGIVLEATDFLHINGVRTTLSRIPDIDYVGDWWGLKINNGFRNVDMFGFRAANFRFSGVDIDAYALDLNGRLDGLAAGVVSINGLYISTSIGAPSDTAWSDLITLRNVSVANITGLTLRPSASGVNFPTLLRLESDHTTTADRPSINFNQTMPRNVTTLFSFGTGGGMESINIGIPASGVVAVPTGISAAGTEDVDPLGPATHRRNFTAGSGAYTYDFVFPNTFAKIGQKIELFILMPTSNATVRFVDHTGTVRRTITSVSPSRVVNVVMHFINVGSGVPGIRTLSVTEFAP